jgi:Protein of unknown function (DUF3343).
MDKYYMLTFENTLGAINGESELKEKKIKVEIMPTPTSITKSCGISIKVKSENIQEIKSLIEENKIRVKNIYFRDEYGYKLYEL